MTPRGARPAVFPDPNFMPSLRFRRSVLPGFGLSLGITLTYLGLLVLIPLSAAFIKTAGMSWHSRSWTSSWSYPCVCPGLDSSFASIITARSIRMAAAPRHRSTEELASIRTAGKWHLTAT